MHVLIYGLINSMILSLLALGFALSYSISRIPNFAHGALYVTAGYLVWISLNKLHLPYPIAAALGVLLTGLIGTVIYRLVLIKVRGMSLSEIIATYAIGIAILEALRWAGLRGMTFMLPVFVPGTVEVLGVAVDYQRVIAVLCGFAVVGLLYLFTHRTRVGLSLRGIAQDERAALMLGIDSDFTALLSLGIGSALVALAALLLFPLGNIVVEAGYSTLIYSLAVCVVGGLGSLLGTILASFVIGYAQILTDHFLSTHYQMIVALMAIVLILVFRPSGLFGRQKELEERV